MVSEFDKDTYEQIKLQLFNLKLQTFIGNKIKAGRSADEIKEKLIVYLKDMNLDTVEDN
jgi:hypothetical protein